MANTKKKRKISEKTELILCIATVCLLAIIIIVSIIYTRGKQKKNNGSADVTPLVPARDYTEESQAYSAGLNDDGKIIGISDINSCVELPDLREITLYLKDYPLGTDEEKLAAGQYILDVVCERATVIPNADYNENLEKLYDYIAHGWFESYTEAMKSSNGTETVYDNFEDYLLHLQGMDQAHYEEFIKKAARKECVKYMVVQALVEKLGITVNEDDILTYARYADQRANSEDAAKQTIERFGKPYMYQRTAEYKLLLRLPDEVTRKDASITEEWEDNSAVYSAGLYDNGRISGIGDISKYVTLADSSGKEFENSEEFISYMLENSEIKVYDDYVDALKQRLAFQNENEPADNENAAIDECKYRMLIQGLFDSAGLATEDYRDAYFADSSSENIKHYEYSYGTAYLNQNIMEFAVREYYR